MELYFIRGKSSKRIRNKYPLNIKGVELVGDQLNVLHSEKDLCWQKVSHVVSFEGVVRYHYNKKVYDSIEIVENDILESKPPG